MTDGGYLRGEWIPAEEVTSRMLEDPCFRVVIPFATTWPLSEYAWGEHPDRVPYTVGYLRCLWCARLYDERRTSCPSCGGAR